MHIRMNSFRDFLGIRKDGTGELQMKHGAFLEQEGLEHCFTAQGVEWLNEIE